jgi:uncharacterized membrane protein YfcA
MVLLSLAFGAIVGLSLGLTGGGGAVFAVPLLVYGLSVEPRQAVGISLAAVGLTAAVGLLIRWKAGQVEVATGLLFAVAGMIGAPIGSWLSGIVPESLLLVLFALLMFVVAVRMWKNAAVSCPEATYAANSAADVDGPTCRRDAAGELRLTSPCAMVLCVVGVLTGVLSGMFGVGGGFVIVPALVLFTGMAIHRAVGTSLLVITLICVAGVASHLLAQRAIPLDTTLYFVGGGVLGMFAGIWISRFLSGPALQRGFAAVIVAVAVFVILRNTAYPSL